MEVVRVPVLNDNYVWLLHSAGVTAVVDPAVQPPVEAVLKARGWSLDLILNTHHHGDHVGANLRLKAAHGCTIVGPGPDRDRIPGIDVEVDEGDVVTVGEATARVLFVPGHTRRTHSMHAKRLGCPAHWGRGALIPAPISMRRSTLTLKNLNCWCAALSC